MSDPRPDPKTDPQLPAPIAPADRLLTAAEFHRLADVPPEIEWFANIRNRHTRRSYENAIGDFMRFAGIVRPEEFRTVTRAHVIAWRDDLAPREPCGAPSGIASRRCRRCSNISAKKTPSPITRSKASSGRKPRAAKARRRRSAITRPVSCSPHPAMKPSRRSATAPSCRRCSITRCAARSCASSRSGISGTRAAASRISGSPARARRPGICRCIQAPTN